MNYIDRFRLDGKVALVNGGSRGIGEAVCHGLAEQGAHVVVASRRQESCDKVAADIRERGLSAEAHACHGGKLEAIDTIMAHVEKTLGRLDVLVNNAGTNPYFGAVEETPIEAFDKVVEVNYRGPFYFCEKAVTLMKQNDGGNIVNVASISGIVPGVLQGAYSTTKAALINVTKTFALECGPDVRANTLCPGLVDTKLASALTADKDMIQSVVEKWPMKRIGQPEDMVGAVLYMASDASAFMTGQVMIVDGGATNTLL